LRLTWPKHGSIKPQPPNVNNPTILQGWVY